MGKILVIVLCSLIIASNVSKNDMVTFPPSKSLAADLRYATDYERQVFLNSFFQDTFSTKSPLVTKTNILVEDILEVNETVCFRFIHECDIRISPLFLTDISSVDELIVSLGHEVGHLVKDMPALMGMINNAYVGTFIEREMAADAYAAKLIPYGACYLGSALSKAFRIVKENHRPLTKEEISTVDARLNRLQKLCNSEVQ